MIREDVLRFFVEMVLADVLPHGRTYQGFGRVAGAYPGADFGGGQVHLRAA